MAIVKTNSLKAPYNDQVLDDKGLLSRIWQTFIIKVQSAVDYIGQELAFPLVNNQAVAAAITDLLFDYQYTSFAIIDYVIQRVTSTTELIQSGSLHAVYKPDADTWSIREYGTAGPDASGITFSITSAGQVKYTSSSLGGTESISRIVFRVRKFAGKSNVYSKVG